MTDTPKKGEKPVDAPQVEPANVVQIPLAEWQAMVAKINRHEQAIDRGRLAAIDAKDSKPTHRFVKLSTYVIADGTRKVIVGWRMLKDEVERMANGVWVENQRVELIFEDNTKQDISLVDFYRKTQEKLACKVLKREADPETQVETFNLEAEDGRQFVVSGSFVN